MYKVSWRDSKGRWGRSTKAYPTLTAAKKAAKRGFSRRASIYKIQGECVGKKSRGYRQAWVCQTDLKTGKATRCKRSVTERVVWRQGRPEWEIY
jgi:hypothetical protein